MSYRRIRELREDHDLKQRELAAILCCSQQTYSDYEHGRVDIPTSVLITLAEFYGTTTDYLLGLTNQMESPWKSEEVASVKGNTAHPPRKPRALLNVSATFE